MHGVYASVRGRLSVVQTTRREDKQNRHGFTKNGLESIFDSHRRMDNILPLYLVGLYQGAMTEGLTGCFLPWHFIFPGLFSKTVSPIPPTAFQRRLLFPCSYHWV